MILSELWGGEKKRVRFYLQPRLFWEESQQRDTRNNRTFLGCYLSVSRVLFTWMRLLCFFLTQLYICFHQCHKITCFLLGFFECFFFLAQISVIHSWLLFIIYLTSLGVWWWLVRFSDISVGCRCWTCDCLLDLTCQALDFSSWRNRADRAVERETVWMVISFCCHLSKSQNYL